jgi:integrase
MAVTILLCGKTQLGWRRGGLVGTRTDVMIYQGKRTPCENAHYEILYYDCGKAKYRNVGTDLKNAERKREWEAQRAWALKEIPGTPKLKPTPTPAQTIAELTPLFIDKYARADASEDTRYNYMTVANEFARLLAKRGKTMPAHINEDDVLAYDGELAKTMSKRTRSGKYTYVRCFLSYMGLDPKKVVSEKWHRKLKTYPKKEVEIYSVEEIEKLIAGSSDYFAMVWQTMWKLGLRDTEMAFLEWTNIDFERKVAMVRFKPKGSFDWNPELEWKPKTSKEREITIPQSLYDKLVAWRKEYPNIRFVLGTANDRPNIKLLAGLKAAWRRAGLACGRCKGCTRLITVTLRHGKTKQVPQRLCSRAKLKTFRSTYCTTLLDHTNLRNMMKLAGHSNLATSEKYLRPAASKEMQHAVNAAFK